MERYNIKNEEREVGYIEYAVADTTLKIDYILIYSNFRGRGYSKKGLLELIQKHNIQIIESTLVGEDNKNRLLQEINQMCQVACPICLGEGIIVDKVTSDEVQCNRCKGVGLFDNFDPSIDNIEDKTYESYLTEAVKATPAYKARQSIGFSTITEIYLDKDLSSASAKFNGIKLCVTR